MKIDLKPFCADDDDPRYYLRTPFNLNGYTVAVDGHVCVRVGLDDSYNDLQEDKCESISNVLNKHFHDVESINFKPFKALPDLVYCDCKACAGTGFMIKRQCHECDGEGELTLSSSCNDYEVDCYSCSGKGEITIKNTKETCIECNGSKQIVDHFKNTIELGGSRVNNYLMKPVAELPNAMYAYTGDMAYIVKFDGGHAIVMGTR